MTNSLINKAKQIQLERVGELNRIPVELQVRDVEHARSAEVLTYSIEQMSKGTTWNELRRKLGLGPSATDRRWRVVREMVLEGLVPSSEEEALRAQANMRLYILDKLQVFVEDVEGMIEALPNNEEDRKLLPNFMKLRLESIRTMLDENKRSFDAYVEIKKAKQIDKLGRGASFIIQNNYHINRPGATPRDVNAATDKVSSLLTQSQNMVKDVGSSSRE